MMPPLVTPDSRPPQPQEPVEDFLEDQESPTDTNSVGDQGNVLDGDTLEASSTRGQGPAHMNDFGQSGPRRDAGDSL